MSKQTLMGIRVTIKAFHYLKEQNKRLSVAMLTKKMRRKLMEPVKR